MPTQPLTITEQELFTLSSDPKIDLVDQITLYEAFLILKRHRITLSLSGNA